MVSAALNPKRPLIQLSGLAGEVKTEVELFMPMGMSVYPTGNEDIVLLQVGGSRSHLVALFADNPALRIADLQPANSATATATASRSCSARTIWRSPRR